MMKIYVCVLALALSFFTTVSTIDVPADAAKALSPGGTHEFGNLTINKVVESARGPGTIGGLMEFGLVMLRKAIPRIISIFDTLRKTLLPLLIQIASTAMQTSPELKKVWQNLLPYVEYGRGLTDLGRLVVRPVVLSVVKYVGDLMMKEGKHIFPVEEESTKGSVEDSTKKSVEDSAENSDEDSAENSGDDAAESSGEDSTENSMEDSKESSMEDSKENPMEDSAENPVKDLTESKVEMHQQSVRATSDVSF